MNSSDDSRLGLAFALVVVLALGAAVGLFLVDAGAESPEPVAFEDTVEIGLSMEARHATDSEVELPRAQAFYSQYRYVVGYYGVERVADAHQQERHAERFGHPIAVYVTDYAGTDVTLDDDRYPRTEQSPDWIERDDAVYVIDSGARTPAGEAALPFSDADEAESFADKHGGTVVGWAELSDRSYEFDDASAVRDRLDEQRADADQRVAEAEQLRDRPVSVVVGEDAPTISAAVERAPPNTTVRVPEGTYEETVEIEKPITLSGPNATLRGDGNGTVLTATADRTAVVGLSVEGVGDSIQNPDAVDGDAWDHNVEQGYGHGDAAISMIEAEETLVADVTVETPANGILLRDAPDAVVTDATVDGTEEWGDGFMGVLAMRSPGVVENSTVEGGRDGVYSHHSDGLVVRDNELSDGRFGIHLMYTSDALLENNDATGQELMGIVVMTGPERIGIVGNEIRDSSNGIATAGSDSYVAENVVVGTEHGLSMNARSSIYERNVLADNDVGARATSIVPTDRVVDNDFVGNDQHLTAGSGALRIWTQDGSGNYWAGAPGAIEGDVLDRTYVPTDPVDARLHQTDGALTLAESPGVETARSLRGTVPGMREGSVVDHAPLAQPANPELVDRALAENGTADSTTDSISHANP